MPRCYMVKKGGQRHEGPPPCSPTEASVAPPCYSPGGDDGALTDRGVVEYAELVVAGSTGPEAGGPAGAVCLAQRSAADTEAAHELLSLAAGAPPPAVLTVLEPQPIYTYTLQPTNIYILAEEPPIEPVYHAVQTLAPAHTFEYTIDHNLSYVAYQPAALPPPPPPPELEPDLGEEPKPDLEDLSSATQDTKEKNTKYDCNECGKRYATSSNLSRHKQTHRSLDSVSAKRCGECGKAYVSMPALAMHVLTHRMGHVCSVCGKQFSRPWLLRGHLRSHTGEKPYSCAACGKAFADRSNLRAHLQTHSSDKKYECTRCHKTFALKSYLNKHQESACVREDDE